MVPDDGRQLAVPAQGLAWNHSTWDRIAVVGSTGAGKSTLSRRLAERLDSKHVELDALHFEPGWRPRPLEEFRADLAKVVAGDRWITDGNWSPARDLIWARATAVVWLDYSLATCFRRTLWRSVRRAWTGELVCGGNRETFRMTFASRDSVLLWVLQTHGSRRRETPRDLIDPRWAPLHAVRLQSQIETDAWFATLIRR